MLGYTFLSPQVVYINNLIETVIEFLLRNTKYITVDPTAMIRCRLQCFTGGRLYGAKTSPQKDLTHRGVSDPGIYAYLDRIIGFDNAIGKLNRSS